MLAKTYSATLQGIDGIEIQIQVGRQRALPRIHITGLPGEIIQESRERVSVCLSQLGFDVPSTRILVHLSPASSRKQGSQFDLAIAMGILVAEQCLAQSCLQKTAFLGELNLDGTIQPISGAIALIEVLEHSPNVERILIPEENGWEAALIGSQKARVVRTVGEVLAFLRAEIDLPRPARGAVSKLGSGPSIDQVIGQEIGKRALEIALAGKHHLLLIGPPGVGKTLLANCAPALLPPLSDYERIDVAKIQGALGSRGAERGIARPFRTPHHSISAAGLLGGGSATVIPGEVTLAHHGVLFLDEFPEFRKDVLEGLREPLQNGAIHLHRIGQALTLPSRFVLLAAMNPCPCGYALHSSRRCSCPWERINAYRKRVSGAILDRLDLCVELSTPQGEKHPTAAKMKSRIAGAIHAQRQRYGDRGPRNGEAEVDLDLPEFQMAEAARTWWEALSESRELSFRGLHKTLRVARTIADLAGEEILQTHHLQEAKSLRTPDALECR